MGAVFANAPTEPTVVEIQVRKIYYDTGCSIRRCGSQATTNIRPVDHIGRPQGNMDVCDAHAGQLIERAHPDTTGGDCAVSHTRPSGSELALPAVEGGNPSARLPRQVRRYRSRSRS
jgi:hypothetical protein